MTGDTRDTEDGRAGPKIEVLQLAAGALSSITAAVIGSRLGVNGTIIGAALGSIVGTVASATYAEFLARTATRVRTVVQNPAATAPPEAVQGDTVLLEPVPTHPPRHHAAAHWQPPAEPRVPSSSSAPARHARRPWRGVALVVIATFVVVVGALTAFELLSGRTLSSFTGGPSDGGTSISNVLDPAPAVEPTADLPSPDPTVTVTVPTTSTPSPSTPTSSTPVPTTTTPVPTTTAPSATTPTPTD